jgi:hypothetical protein
VEESVTEVIGNLSIPGLPWAAGRENTTYDIHHLAELYDEVAEFGAAEVINRHRRHFQGVWDGRAAMGTLIHRCPEAWEAMRPFDVYAEVCKQAESTPTWQGREEQVADEAERYVDGLEKFWWDFTPHPIDTEFVVRQPGDYIGTCDMLCEMRGEVWRLDWKTTAEQDPKKGVHSESWALQLAALDRAPERVDYRMERNGKGKWMPVEVATLPHERADRCGIVLLRGDGLYTLLEVQADDEAYEAFMALCYVGKWQKNLAGAKPVSKGMSA